jgi:hypothetical protein
MTHRPPTRRRDSNPAQSQEDRLLDLLRKAEGYAYALAHGYDIGGHTDRAYGLVTLGERIRDTAMDVSDLARPVEPDSVAPALGLSWRAFSLRRLLRGTRGRVQAWHLWCQTWPASRQSMCHSGRSPPSNLTELAERLFGFGKVGPKFNRRAS